MKINLPNILTIIRLVLAPVFYYLLLSEDIYLQQISIVLFLIASGTDYYDGYFARKYGIVTSAGKFLDPLADKFLTIAAFIAFAVMNLVPFWMVIIVILRDLVATLLRVYKENEFQTSYFAKIKTSLQMIFIALILLVIFIRNIVDNIQTKQALNNILTSRFIYYLMFILTFITILTLIEYLKIIFIKKNALIKEDNEKV